MRATAQSLVNNQVYEYYDDLQAVQTALTDQADDIQCIVTSAKLEVKNQVVDFGSSQQPALWDYADGVDTMAFLAGI